MVANIYTDIHTMVTQNFWWRKFLPLSCNMGIEQTRPLAINMSATQCIVHCTMKHSQNSYEAAEDSAWSNKVNIGQIYEFAMNKYHPWIQSYTQRYSISKLKSLNCVFFWKFLESVCVYVCRILSYIVEHSMRMDEKLRFCCRSVINFIC